MSEISLKASEAKILAEAAAREGRIVFPDRMKESTRRRIAGLFAKCALSEPADEEGELRLTSAGYIAVGLEPPRAEASASAPRGAKRDLVLELLGRGEGASLAELVVATGWLPHTTRAVLSRLRLGGQVLAKAKRDDGVTAYRMLPPEPAAPIRRGRRPRAEIAA